MIRQLGVVAVVALLLALLGPVTAVAGTLLAAEDEVDLAQTLAEAQQEQEVCYGWDIAVYGAAAQGSGDRGSSLDGAGRALDVSRCPKGYAILRGEVAYACESCEEEDAATVSIDSNLRSPPTLRDLERLGFSTSELLGEQDDQAVLDMVGALPLLVAERGNAPFVAYEPATDVPAADKPTNSPGNDLLRDRWPVLVLCGLLLLAGPAYLLYKRGQRALTP